MWDNIGKLCKMLYIAYVIIIIVAPAIAIVLLLHWLW